MKKTIKKFEFLLLTLIFAASSILSCSKEIDEDPLTTVETASTDTDDATISLEGDLQISDFIWQGLNYFYYWQERVPELADTKILDSRAYAQYINENADPEDFFYNLRHEEDRFSWIEDDYEVLENNLQGVFASNGLKFFLIRACEDCNEVVGVVKYILKNSDADGKNIKRGDIFYAVNGTTLTVNNYYELLYGDSMSYTLDFTTYQDNTFTPNGISVALTKEENFESDPIQIAKTLNIGGNPVGYLMYNQFLYAKGAALNAVFGDFKSQGVTDLILDLRYNGGGSVQNCIELASMITGQFNEEIFSQQVWNTKLNAYWQERDPERLTDYFTNELSEGNTPLNSLNLTRLYVITTSESASASELLINGLAPHIEVIQIGELTVGKNVGSITVYDYVDNLGTKNPDHKYAMQPITFKIANSEGFADYANGLTPNVELDESLRNLGTLGEITEPLLQATVNQITGTAKYVPKAVEMSHRELLIKDPEMLRGERMYIDTPFNLRDFMGNDN